MKARLFYLLGCLTPHPLRMLLLRHYLRRSSLPGAERWKAEEAEPFECTHSEGKHSLTLRGWVRHPPRTPRGTVFLLHGFRRDANCRIPEAKLFSERCGLICVAWDARAHGCSDTAVPTFGAMEAGDIRAALARAEQMGLPRPYIGFGSSMGGMALRYLAEEMQGLVLVHTPASLADVLELAPMSPTALLFMREYFIAAEYGHNVLKSTAPLPRAERCPFILAISGENDCYDERRMRASFERLPVEKAYNLFPNETSARAIRYTFPHTGHHGTGKARSDKQKEFPRLLCEAVERIIREQS